MTGLVDGMVQKVADVASRHATAAREQAVDAAADLIHGAADAAIDAVLGAVILA